jgi:ferredoxin
MNPKEGKLQIIHYREKCIGCNACVEAAPDRWAISKKDGKAVLLKAQSKKGIYILNTHPQEYDANLEAAKNCPVNIIHLKIL